MKTIKGNRISKKLFIIMLSISLTAITCLSFFQAYSSYVEGREVAENHQKVVLSSITEVYRDHLLLIQKMMVLSADSRGVLEEGINNRFRFYLWKILKHNESVFEVVAIDRNGKELIFASKIRPELAGDYQDVSKEEYFKSAISGKTFYSKIMYLFDETKPYIVISIPVYKFDGTINTVLACKVWFNTLQKFLYTKMVGKTGYIYTLNVDKQIIAHPEYDLVLKRIKAGEISKSLEQEVDIAIKNPGTFRQVSYVNTKGDRVFATLRYEKDFGFVVVVAQKATEIFYTTLKTVVYFFLISGIVILIVFLVIKKLSLSLSFPIVKLKEVTARISEGDFSTKIEIKTNDEIEELANNFNEMSEKLKKSYEELEKRVAERTKELLLLYSFTSAISKTLNVNEALKNAGEELTVALELDGYVGTLYKNNSISKEDLVYSSLTEEELNIVLAKFDNKNIFSHLSLSHSSYVINIDEDSTFLNYKRLKTIKSIAVFPILYLGKIVGFMIFLSSNGNFFQSNILSVIETCMVQLGVSIANAEKYEFTEELSFKDPLTKLFNRRYFEAKLEDELARWQRYKRETSLCMIDIDFFQKVNDTYGHQSGDAILKQLAQIIQSSIRKSDIAARYGGEEFVLLMPETSLENAYAALERLRKNVEEHVFVIDVFPGTLSITISIGLACFSSFITKKEKLIELADKSLYTAKQTGRNKVVMYKL